MTTATLQPGEVKERCLCGKWFAIRRAARQPRMNTDEHRSGKGPEELVLRCKLCKRDIVIEALGPGQIKVSPFDTLRASQE